LREVHQQAREEQYTEEKRARNRTLENTPHLEGRRRGKLPFSPEKNPQKE